MLRYGHSKAMTLEQLFRMTDLEVILMIFMQEV
jgi:hypothetical protein